MVTHGGSNSESSAARVAPQRAQRRRSARLAPWLAVAGLLAGSGCYYGQAARGHMEIELKSRPVSRVMADPATEDHLRERLELSEQLLQFAEHELALPAAGAYRRYADLGRPFVVWNVFAAPEFSLQPKRWRYPLVGRLAYRGYFNEQRARDLAAQLEAGGFDVLVGGVPAYSTLGVFDDPLLNTFIQRPEAGFAALLFHELAHRRVFYRGDAAASEAFAVTVEREGTRRWLRAHRPAADQLDYERRLDRARQLQRAAAATRAQLTRLYADARRDGGPPETWSDERRESVRKAKREQLDALADQRRRLSGGNGLRSAAGRLPAGELNNAHLIASATYHELVPGFDALLRHHDGDLKAFYRAAEQLKPLTPDQRRDWLHEMAGEH